MRYSAEEDGWGVMPDNWPVDVIDAAGNTVDWVLACDTETGECKVEVLDESSRPVIVNNELMTAWVTRPAPLTLKPIGAV
jgi:hypothetical protein